MKKDKRTLLRAPQPKHPHVGRYDKGKVIQVHLTSAQYQKLWDEAFNRNASVASVVRELVEKIR